MKFFNAYFQAEISKCYILSFPRDTTFIKDSFINCTNLHMHTISYVAIYTPV